MFRQLLTGMILLVVLVIAIMASIAHLTFPDYETRWRLVICLGVTLALSLAVAAGLAGMLAAQFTGPLEDLRNAVENMGKGNGKTRVFPIDQSEVSRVGLTFNRVSETLGRHISALEEDRQQLRTVLSGMVEGVVALDAEQRILFVNARAAELLELAGLTPVGRPLWEVVRHRALLDAVKRALESPEPHREEFNWNGSLTRTLTVHAARLPGTLPRGAVVVLHDTTELRRLERLRQEFVANVSHELKTPLSVIKVCVETLLDGAVEDVHHRGRFLERIARQADRLHALILDLLSLARIESGEHLLDFDSVPVEPIVHLAIERHRPRAEARLQRLELERVTHGLHVWGDEEAVDQILENLLDNALKYTPEGGSVRVRLEARDGQGIIEVIDTGIGIPESDLPRVFERFYRVDKARSRELGGTGLGLSIIKHLLQALHGSVRATSQVGKGTTFTVHLPLARP